LSIKRSKQIKINEAQFKINKIFNDETKTTWSQIKKKTKIKQTRMNFLNTR
jgi:hypothetical protein